MIYTALSCLRIKHKEPFLSSISTRRILTYISTDQRQEADTLWAQHHRWFYFQRQSALKLYLQPTLLKKMGKDVSKILSDVVAGWRGWKLEQERLKRGFIHSFTDICYFECYFVQVVVAQKLRHPPLYPKDLIFC